MNVVVDAATYFLHDFRRMSGHDLHAELVVEPRSLLLKSLLGFVKLVEMGMLPLKSSPPSGGRSPPEVSGEVSSPPVDFS
jgi:hypothetical protein